MSRGDSKNQRKLICYFSSSWRGGDGWYSHALAQAIAEAGQPIIFVASRLIPLERDAKHELISRRLVHSNVSKAGGFISKLLRSGRRVLEFTFFMILARLRARTYLITFPHWLIFTFVLFLLLKATRAKIVYIVHDPLPHAWSFPGVLRGVERWLLAQTYSLSDQLVTLTASGKATLVEEFQTDPAIIDVIPHGAFPLPGAKPPEATRKILLFGMLRRNKNILPTIEAVDLVSKQYQDLELYIAGAPHADDRSYWADCERKISESAAKIHVEAGFISEERMMELFHMCDAVILPYESFNSQSGVAVLAAFAKRPVLTTGVGGIGELINMGLASFPIDGPVTADAIARSLMNFCRQDPRVLSERIESGYLRLSDELSWQGVGKSFADLLESAEKD